MVGQLLDQAHRARMFTFWNAASAKPSSPCTASIAPRRPGRRRHADRSARNTGHRRRDPTAVHLGDDPQPVSCAEGAIGIWTVCFTLGGVLDPLVGGLLLQHFWRGSVFLLGVPVMAALVVLGPIFLPEFRKPDGLDADFLSVAMSMVALLAMAYGVKHVGEGGVTAAVAVAFVIGGSSAGRSFAVRTDWLLR